jgi:hypothetical protein
MKANNKIQLSGKCTIQIDTGMSNLQLQITKQDKNGNNNADALIQEVFNFAIMRHGTEGALNLLKEKIKTY